MIHQISQFMASIDALPDSVVLLACVIGFFLVYGLMDERDRTRRARWTPPAARPQPKPEDKREAA